MSISKMLEEISQQQKECLERREKARQEREAMRDKIFSILNDGDRGAFIDFTLFYSDAEEGDYSVCNSRNTRTWIRKGLAYLGARELESSAAVRTGLNGIEEYLTALVADSVDKEYCLVVMDKDWDVTVVSNMESRAEIIGALLCY